jgi:limonene 1,2-monooxygenase
MPIAVAAVQSPAGPALAGKYGAWVLTITVPRDPSTGPSDLKYLWSIAEESAAEHEQTVQREDWRLVMPVHLAESRKEAMEEARLGAGRYYREYFEHTMGRQPVIDGPVEKIIDAMVERGAWIVGTPDDCIEGIKRLDERSGGFGGFLVQTIDWAPREKLLHSYELLARYVMPQFQGSVASTAASNRWAYERREVLMGGRVRAIDRAKEAYAQRQKTVASP